MTNRHSFLQVVQQARIKSQPINNLWVGQHAGMLGPTWSGIYRQENWNASQQKRAALLFETFPQIKSTYELTQQIRQWLDKQMWANMLGNRTTTHHLV